MGLEVAVLCGSAVKKVEIKIVSLWLFPSCSLSLSFLCGLKPFATQAFFLHVSLEVSQGMEITLPLNRIVLD